MNVRTIVMSAIRFACLLMVGMTSMSHVALAAPKDKKADKKINVTKLKSVQDLVTVMKKNNFAPFTVIKAWYGTNGNIGKNSIDVQAIMQSYADRGVFPDPDVEVAKMQAAGTLSAAQKALPQDQAMNIFFGKDPKIGDQKTLHVEFMTRTATEGAQGYVIEIPEWKNKRGTYDALPVAPDAMVSISQPAVTLPNIVNSTYVPSAYPENNLTPALTPVQMGAVCVAAPGGELQQGVKIDPNAVVWPADGTITLQQLGNALIKNGLQPFTIVDAWYGVQGNANNLTDKVKTKLQDYADKGLFTVPKDMNDFFGKDPVKGSKKVLYIKFTMQGHTYDISIPANKKDRGDYQLPSASAIFKWGQGKIPGAPSVAWVRGDNLGNAISNAVAGRRSILSLDSLTYEDRINNAFNILGAKSTEQEKDLFVKELTYLVTNRVLGDAEDLDLLGALLKYARVPLAGDTARLATVADLAKNAGVDLAASNYIDAMQALIPVTTMNKDQFLALGQRLVDMSKNGKLTYEEATKAKGVLYAAELLIKNDQVTLDAVKALDAAIIVPVAAIPGSTTPTTEQAPTAIAAPTTTQAPASVTYADRIDAAMKVSSFADDKAKDDYLTTLDGLVADRASGSDDNLTVLQGAISYYASVSPFFKDDARQARLKTMLTTLNSGITYADRLKAVDPLVKAAILSDGQKAAMFNLLMALAKEQAKASAMELSVARANLIVAQSKYTSDDDKTKFSSIEATFNTPPAPTAAPAAQAATAAAVVAGDNVTPAQATASTAGTSTTVAATTPAQAAGAAVAADVVAAAAAAAAGTTPATTATSTIQRYSDRLMNGFSTLVVAKTANTDEAITGALKSLSGLVDDRYLATGDDKKSLDMLVQFATMNFSDPKYADQIKAIAASAGTDIGFAVKLQKFNEMMMNPNFVSAPNYQKDTLALAQNLVNSVDKTSQNDVINLKASLMAAQRLLINAADATAVQNMQQGLSVAAVSSNPLPVATAASTDASSFKARVAAAAAVTTFAADADKDAFMTQLDGLVNDRARGDDDDIKALNSVLDAASKNSALGQSYQDRIKGFVATMSRPITSSERVAEQEEMTAIVNISDAQLAEVVYNMGMLAKDIANISANDLVRIKSHLVVFAPRITNADLKKQFDAAKAIFDAPVQVVAPVAAAATGAAVPTTVTTSSTGQAAAAAAAAITTSRRTASSSQARTTTTSTQQVANLQRQLDAAKKRLASAKTTAQKSAYQRQVDSLNAKLQKLQVTTQPAAATVAPAVVAESTAATPVVAATTTAATTVPATTPSTVSEATAAAPAETTSETSTAVQATATTASTSVATAVPATSTSTPVATTAASAKLTPSQVSVLKNRLSYYQKSVVTLSDRLAKADPASASAKAMQASIDRYNVQVKKIQDQLAAAGVK